MLLMAGPMCLLFEGAIQIARVVDKRRAKREAARGLPRRRRRRGLAAGRRAVLAGRRATTPQRTAADAAWTSPCWSAPPPAGAGPARRRRRPRRADRRRADAAVLPPRPGADAEQQAAAAVAEGAGAVVASAGTAPCTPRCRRSPGRRRRWPSSPPAPATTSRWPSACPRDPVGGGPRRGRGPRAGVGRPSTPGAPATWWATVLCCGFDSAVSDRANRLRWPRGPRRYDVAILAELARLRPREVSSSSTARRSRGRSRWSPSATPPGTARHADLPAARPGRRAVRRRRRRPDEPPELVRSRPRLTAGTHVEHPAVTVHRARGWSCPGRVSPPTPTASRSRRCPPSPSACPAR